MAMDCPAHIVEIGADCAVQCGDVICTVNCGKTTWKVHKGLLCRRSLALKATLLRFPKSEMGVINIYDRDPVVVGWALVHMYTRTLDHIPVPTDGFHMEACYITYGPLLLLAKELGMDPLEQTIVDHLCQLDNPDRSEGLAVFGNYGRAHNT